MRRVSSTAALIIAAAAVAFTAACGGSGDSTGNGQTPGNTGGNGNNQFAAYVQCLQQNGVTITMPSFGARNRPSDGASRGPRPSGQPRPSGSGFPRGGGFPGGGGGFFQKPDNVDQATWDKAQSACASLRPSMGAGGNRGNRGNGDAAYRNCLRDHGVTAANGNIDTNDETVKKAMETCKVLQPQASATPSA